MIMAFTDIRKWQVIEKLPDSVKPYIYLMRLDRPIGWWLLLLPSWWSILLASENITAYTFFLLALFLVGAVIMRAAGCIINDLWDRDLDKKVERTASRPIASGQISLEDATIFLCLLLLCGLGVLFCLPWTTIFLGFCVLPFIVLYPYMKRITWWPQLFLGITFNFGALMGWSSVTGSITWESLILYVACIFWTLGYDTIYAHQDKEDDLKVGIKSTAILFGEKSRTYVFGFYATAAFLFLCVLFNSPVSWGSFILVLLTFCYAAYRLGEWKLKSQQSSLDMFKDNRDIGLLIFIALAL